MKTTIGGSMSDSIQFRAAARIGIGDGLALILARKHGMWEPTILLDSKTGVSIDVPINFDTRAEVNEELDVEYVTWLFNELHKMLAASNNEEFAQAIDAMHHDYQESKGRCDHTLKDTSTLKYVADFAAPGYGRQYSCQECGEAFAVIGLSVYPASDGAHIMDASDVE